MAILRRLDRSTDAVIGGVCAGLAEWLGWNAESIRALFVLLWLLTDSFVVVFYVLLWFMMPPADGGRFRLEDFRQQ